MNTYEKTILGKFLKAFGRVYEGAAFFGLFYNAIYPNPDSPENAYISAGVGAAGMCLAGMGNALLKQAKKIEETENRERIRTELEQMVRDEHAGRMAGFEVRIDELGKALAANYAKTERRRG